MCHSVYEQQAVLSYCTAAHDSFYTVHVCVQKNERVFSHCTPVTSYWICLWCYSPNLA